jgi:cold shock CspA family protein
MPLGKARQRGRIERRANSRREMDTATRLGYWTFPDVPRTRHALVVIGQIKFYDEATAWGVIQGADGGLYAMRGDQFSGPPFQVGDQVVFEPQPAPGGPRANAIRLARR